MELVHLWLHESSRVYSDKLMEEKDVELFNKILLDTGKRYFDVRNKEQNNLMFTMFKHLQYEATICRVCLAQNKGSISSHVMITVECLVFSYFCMSLFLLNFYRE